MEEGIYINKKLRIHVRKCTKMYYLIYYSVLLGPFLVAKNKNSKMNYDSGYIN